ncbi:MAG TPA: amidase [Solirubrobacteraceae bacterium]|nr:amidase [Solirubrobacteraceae bacterium]
MDPFASATSLVAAILAGELSAVEALEAQLARVADIDPQLGAVVALDTERARADAAAADAARARGESAGPLQGLPMTIKDSWETEGLVTACGTPALAGHVPAADAPAVARLRAAGAVIFGKTNAPFMASDVQTYNDVYGTTRNPWDLERTPGGSSGGAAAALAAGLTALELGSDIGGSIRTPASWCGVYGHKTSYGIVPQRGHIPGLPGTLVEADLNVAGPLARSAEDLDLALGILAGPDRWDVRAWRLELPAPRATALRDFRVAAWLEDPACPVDDAVRARLEALVEALRGAGVAVDADARPALTLADAGGAYLPLLGAVIGAGLPAEVYDRLLALVADADPDDDSPLVRYARALTVSARDRLFMDGWRQQQRAAWADFFERYDVLLMPVTVVPAIPHDHSDPIPARTITVNAEERSYLDLFGWIAPASAALLPATAAPAGATAGGLPVGVQIVGPFLEDRTPIAFARALAEVAGGFVPPPALARA